MERRFKAGAAQADITPPLGIRLGGYPHEPRHNTGANDPLTASCLYLENEENAILFIGLDLLSLSRAYILQLRKQIAKESGIPENNIMVSCSHSHSAPALAGGLDTESQAADHHATPEYIRFVLDAALSLADRAKSTAVPCEVGFGAAECGPAQGIGGNRRDPENGPSDPHVYALAARDLCGKVIGILVNYALHPTLLHAENTLCSADYPAYIRKRLQDVFPSAAMVFNLGAAGDQSSRYFRSGQTFAEAERFGNTMAEGVRRAILHAEFEESGEISVCSAPFTPALRTFPDPQIVRIELNEKRKMLQRAIDENAGYLTRQNAELAVFGAEGRLAYSESVAENREIRVKEDELPSEICHAKIGQANILFLPGEIFMGVAKRIREKSGLRELIITTMSNGYLPGYMFTENDVDDGGYEVDVSMLDASAASQAADVSLKLIGKTK